MYNHVQVIGCKNHDNNKQKSFFHFFMFKHFFFKINIAALRIAADKFDPDFIEKRKVALEVFQIVFLQP